MNEHVTSLSDYFSLKAILNNALKGFSFPQNPFDPNGTWKNSYKVLTLTGQSWPIGKLTIERILTKNDQTVLIVSYQLFLKDGYKQNITSRIRCLTDSLATPLTWKFESEILSPAKKTIDCTRLEKQGEARNGILKITTSNGSSRTPLSKAYTSNWALFDAIQRLPRQSTVPINFTLLDHFDQPKHNQVLSFRKESIIEFKGDSFKLYAYQQIGNGITPIIYWTNRYGRLLFVISGIEGYVIENE